MDYRHIFVDPLTPTIGAEISGVDLREPLDDETFEEVHGALVAHGVVFFRDQAIDHEQHLAFGRRFGPLHIHPAAPCVDGNPELMLIHTDANSTRQNGEDWHSDVSCDEEPPMGSVLAPPQGAGVGRRHPLLVHVRGVGGPLGADEGAPRAARGPARVGAPLRRGERPGLYGDATVRRRNEWPSAVHPVVRTHPVSGRPALYVNRIFTRRILGVTERESRALLDFLFEHVTNPHFQCRFRWREHSVAFWDNRCVQHHAMWDYYPETRTGTRVTVAGDRPNR